nr:DUF805 domain-containing protein [uncultured Ottowia sp.]
MSDGSEKIWWYAVGQEKFGPCTGGELARLARKGVVMPDTLVWREGMTEWVRASKLTKLWERATQPPAPHASEQLPPPPPAAPGRAVAAVPELEVAHRAQGPSSVPPGGHAHGWSAGGAAAASRSSRAGRRSSSDDGSAGFLWAIQQCFRKYFDFSGRARRAECWYFMLFQLLLLVALVMLFFVSPQLADNLASVAGLVLLIPTFSVGARRLHDVGRSGWWQLLCLTGIGIFVLLFWFVQPSDEGRNDYGEDPTW